MQFGDVLYLIANVVYVLLIVVRLHTVALPDGLVLGDGWRVEDGLFDLAIVADQRENALGRIDSVQAGEVNKIGVLFKVDVRYDRVRLKRTNRTRYQNEIIAETDALALENTLGQALLSGS